MLKSRQEIEGRIARIFESAWYEDAEVEVHHVVEGRVAAAAHLPVAGEAGLDGEAAHGALVVLGDLGGQGRPRAYAGDPFCQDENAFYPLIKGDFSRIGSHFGLNLT